MVERQRWIAACQAEVVEAAADQRGLPGRTTVEADALEHPGQREVNVADHHDVLGVGRVDGDRLFRLVLRTLADVHVSRRGAGPGRAARGRGPDRAAEYCQRQRPTERERTHG